MGQRLRCLRQHRCRRDGAGFVLPLASAGALVLLLGSLSIHGAAVQQLARVSGEWQGLQRSDRLDGAAQRLAAALAAGARSGQPLSTAAAAAAATANGREPVRLEMLEQPDAASATEATTTEATATFALSSGAAELPRRYRLWLDPAAGRVRGLAGLVP
jgi:hypothetical protein